MKINEWSWLLGLDWKLCYSFLKRCLTTFKAYLSNAIRYEKHLLSHILIGLR